MGTIKTEDLCYSCRCMDTVHEGKERTVKDLLDRYNSDPAFHMQNSEAGILKSLLITIVEGEGCTSCGEKILDRCDELMPPRR